MRPVFLAAAVLVGLGISLSASRQAHAQRHAERHAERRAERRAERYTPQCRAYEYGRPDLFYNFYVPPNCGSLGAQMYLAPGPVPPDVGHTYYTYQPLMPHEWLYKHRRTYHKYYNEGRGLTRTKVRWW